MHSASRALFLAFALGPLAVHGLFQHIAFSPVDQCGSFNVSFQGGVPPDALPLRLTIIPFNATPIAITLPDDVWNSTSATGAAVTFLPLAANTTFLASLDDANGDPTGVHTSDIIQIQPSDNDACLPSAPATDTPVYSIVQMPQQCGLFNISYNTAVVQTPPSARVYVPLGPSFTLDMKSSVPGEATYLMNITRGRQVALLANDGAGHNQTSPLITVFGDTASATQCLNGASPASSQVIGDATNTSGGLSTTAVIIIAVCTVVIVGTLSLLAVVFAVRERQKRRVARLRNAFFPRGDPEKINPYVEPGPAVPTPVYMPDPRETRVLTGQPYGAVSPRSAMFLSNIPLTPRTPRSGISEKSGVTDALSALPSPPPPPMLSRPSPRNKAVNRPPSLGSLNARTLASLDIEQILEQAAVSPGAASAITGVASPSSNSPLAESPRANTSPVTATPVSTILRISPVSSKRDAQELDVPASATPSGRFSDYSPTQEVSPTNQYRGAPFLDPPPFSAGSRRNPNFLSPTSSTRR